MPSRVAVDEKQVEIDGGEKALFGTPDTASKLLMEIDVYSRCGADIAAAFLHRLFEKQDVADAALVVDGASYLSALARRELSGHLDDSKQKHIEYRFQTVTM